MEAEFALGRTVITGGNGFIGAHLIRRLLATGMKPCVLVVKGESVQRLAGLNLEVQEFSAPEALGRVVAELKPEIVFHLGAMVSNQRTLDGFHATLRWNLLSTLGLYEALSGLPGLRRLVQIGSCEEYGRQPAPFRESAAPDPVSPYSASKAAIACYARMFQSCFSLPVVVLRPSVIYGPGQDPKMLIPEVITALLEGRTVDTTEGRQTRDFLYVDDFVDALLRAAVLPGIEGEIFNAGSGESVSVRRCIETIEDIIGRRELVRFGAKLQSASEIWEYAPDTLYAQERLGWRASTSLQRGLQLTIAAYEAALNSSKFDRKMK